MPAALVSCALLAALAMAQPPKPDPVGLEVLVKGLANPSFVEVPELTEEIQKRGINFAMGAEQFGDLLDAANRGRRDSKQVAALILACLRACQQCRAGVLAPLSEEELKRLVRWGFTPDGVLQEARVRGVKGVEISEGEMHVLKEAGVSDDVIRLAVPEDRVPTIPLVGYNMLMLKRAEEYDLSAPEGWLKVSTELPPFSQSEFVFKQTALFVRAVSGGDPRDLGAYFNKPAPRNVEKDQIEFQCKLDGPQAEETGNQKKKSRGKEAPAIESAYLSGDADGRHAFRILLSNREAGAHEFSFNLRWRILTTPKTPDPVTK